MVKRIDKITDSDLRSALRDLVDKGREYAFYDIEGDSGTDANSVNITLKLVDESAQPQIEVSFTEYDIVGADPMEYDVHIEDKFTFDLSEAAGRSHPAGEGVGELIAALHAPASDTALKETAEKLGRLGEEAALAIAPLVRASEKTSDSDVREAIVKALADIAIVAQEDASKTLMDLVSAEPQFAGLVSEVFEHATRHFQLLEAEDGESTEADDDEDTKDLSDLIPSSSHPAGEAAVADIDTEQRGGIDFSAIFKAMNIKQDGLGNPLPVEMQNLEMIPFEGIQPFIINITPVTVFQLPMVLGYTHQEYEHLNRMFSKARELELEQLARVES